jgi:hypothetical protein
MISYTQPEFEVATIIEEHLVTPTSIVTDGLLGRFDTLRVALEHLLTYGGDHAGLGIKSPGEELQFSEGALMALIEGFAEWLQDAGLSTPVSKPAAERHN